MNIQRPIDIKPRRDLREPAFRRYEKYIAKACQQSYTLDPTDLAISPSTFVARFRDAILAFQRFAYPSDHIPKSCVRELTNVHAYERDDGSIYIENVIADARNADNAAKFALTDFDALRRLVQEVHDRKHPDMVYLPIENAEDAAKAIAFVNSLYGPNCQCYARFHEDKVVLMPTHLD